MNNYVLPILIGTVLLFSSCGFNEAKYYTPSQVNATKANVPVSELVAGRITYINACAECHRLYKPDRHSAEKWTMYLDEMQEKAEISDVEKKQIYLYLTSEIIE